MDYVLRSSLFFLPYSERYDLKLPDPLLLSLLLWYKIRQHTETLSTISELCCWIVLSFPCFLTECWQNDPFEGAKIPLGDSEGLVSRTYMSSPYNLQISPPSICLHFLSVPNILASSSFIQVCQNPFSIARLEYSLLILCGRALWWLHHPSLHFFLLAEHWLHSWWSCVLLQTIVLIFTSRDGYLLWLSGGSSKVLWDSRLSDRNPFFCQLFCRVLSRK